MAASCKEEKRVGPARMTIRRRNVAASRALVDMYARGDPSSTAPSKPVRNDKWPERMLEGLVGDMDRLLQDHIRASHAVNERWHAEMSEAFGIDTKALEKKCLAQKPK